MPVSRPIAWHLDDRSLEKKPSDWQHFSVEMWLVVIFYHPKKHERNSTKKIIVPKKISGNKDTKIHWTEPVTLSRICDNCQLTRQLGPTWAVLNCLRMLPTWKKHCDCSHFWTPFFGVWNSFSELLLEYAGILNTNARCTHEESLLEIFWKMLSGKCWDIHQKTSNHI